MNIDTTNKSPAMAPSDAYQYPLEFWDQLIMVTLNPLKTDLTKITTETTSKLCAKLEGEENALQLLIKKQVFNLGQKDEIELLVRRYHSALTILLEHGLDGQRHLTRKSVAVKNLYKCVLNSMDTLLTFLENRFPDYLGMEIRAPSTYLGVSQKELEKRIDKLKIKRERFGITDPVLDVVFSALFRFIRTTKGDGGLTMRMVLYHKELVQELEKVNCLEKHDKGFSKTEELLILMNFNSKGFTRHLVDSVSHQVDACATILEKIDVLHFYNKGFSQIHAKPGMVFNPQYADLEKVISNWFTEEIKYMEKKLQWSTLGLGIPIDKDKAEQAQQAKEPLKVQVNLSSDQTGLILRAADEARVFSLKIAQPGI